MKLKTSLHLFTKNRIIRIDEIQYLVYLFFQNLKYMFALLKLTFGILNN